MRARLSKYRNARTLMLERLYPKLTHALTHTNTHERTPTHDRVYTKLTEKGKLDL